MFVLESRCPFPYCDFVTSSIHIMFLLCFSQEMSNTRLVGKHQSSSMRFDIQSPVRKYQRSMKSPTCHRPPEQTQEALNNLLTKCPRCIEPYCRISQTYPIGCWRNPPIGGSNSVKFVEEGFERGRHIAEDLIGWVGIKSFRNDVCRSSELVMFSGKLYTYNRKGGGIQSMLHFSQVEKGGFRRVPRRFRGGSAKVRQGSTRILRSFRKPVFCSVLVCFLFCFIVCFLFCLIFFFVCLCGFVS